MVNDSYSNMMPEMEFRSIGKGTRNNYSEDLAGLLGEKASKLEVSDLELSLLRSGSAPLTVEGSLSATLPGDGGILDEMRTDPAYMSYYYKNVKLNPRRPHTLLSKENWRFAKPLQGSSVVGGGSVVGDRRRVDRHGIGEGESLFSKQPDFGLRKGEDKLEVVQLEECTSDGLVGFPGLRLGSKQKSTEEMSQDGLSNTLSVSGHPSHLGSRTFENDESSGSDATDIALESLDAFYSGQNAKGPSSPQSILPLASYSHASSLTASLSRTATSDPQLAAKVSNPCFPPVDVGGGMMSSLDKINGTISKSFGDMLPDMGLSADLAIVLSGMNLSTNSILDEEKYPTSQIHHEIDAHQNLLHLQRDQTAINRCQSLNKSELMRYYKLNRPFANSYLKRPHILRDGGSPSSQYLNIENLNSCLTNNAFSGFAADPASPFLVGNQLGSGNFPHLVENIAAGTAVSDSEINYTVMGGGSSLGPNSLVAAMELLHLGRVGNLSADDALRMAMMDLSYLQYLRSHMELLGLQKPYPEIFLQKSQYGQAFNKTGNLNHGSYGNHAFAPVMSYPRSPMECPVVPNHPFGSSNPVRHGEEIMHFTPGMTNMPGSFMGGNLEGNFSCSLLYEFKSSKTKCFELADIAGHVVEFSADQYGSRFIQQKLETASVQEKNMVFREIMPHGLSLMTDVFGNYVIQKFFEHGNASQIRQLAKQLTGNVLNVSLQMYGCRVIQKAIEVIESDQQTKIVLELDGHVMRCVRDQNGNHVIQKCIKCVPESVIDFIITTFYYQIVTISTHPYGCRVVQRVLEHCHNPKTQSIVMNEILQSVCTLAQDQYGNYVVQHILEHGKPHERSAIINQLIGKIVPMSQQKFASNVVEKCLTFGTPEERPTLINEILGTNDENEQLQVMMKDPFANYVVQKTLETCDDQQLELILNRVKVHLSVLNKYTYGKHIVARVEKLVATGEKRISNLSSSHT